MRLCYKSHANMAYSCRLNLDMLGTSFRGMLRLWAVSKVLWLFGSFVLFSFDKRKLFFSKPKKSIPKITLRLIFQLGLGLHLGLRPSINSLFVLIDVFQFVLANLSVLFLDCAMLRVAAVQG